MNHDLVTIIPVKPPDQSKTRLASILSLAERISLTRRLLEQTIDLAGQVGDVVVISRDAGLRRRAKRAGAWALVESGHGLNEALRQAAAWVTMRGAQAILVLPGDLPLLTRSDLTGLVEAGQPAPSVVIAPCQRSDGTNALLLRPPDTIDFAFGAGSFERHRRAAQAKGLEPIIYRSPTLALDLDLPEDLAALAEARDS
jgi:2-phospho-L-lactate guanylyltransferase